MWPRLGKVRGRIERWQAVREKARKEWLGLSAAERASPRGSFLVIQARGGLVCHAAWEEGLRAAPARWANEWVVYLPGDSDGEVTFRLDLWLLPRRLDGRHEAELHDGWEARTSQALPLRCTRRKTFYKGTVEECVAHAKALFIRWDAVRRLGGVASTRWEWET